MAPSSCFRPTAKDEHDTRTDLERSGTVDSKSSRRSWLAPIRIAKPATSLRGSGAKPLVAPAVVVKPEVLVPVEEVEPYSPPCFLPGEAFSQAAPLSECVLEMSCDMLCVRTMNVSFRDSEGNLVQCSRSGYDAKIFVPSGSTQIRVTFNVVGGLAVLKADRDSPNNPWVKNEQGQLVPESFYYEMLPSQHVQYAIRGTAFRSWVWDVDERTKEECLFELISRDFSCMRTMNINYKIDGEAKVWSGTGFNVKCHLPFSAHDIEVTFSVLGNQINRVNRREPRLPWVVDANNEYPPERFVYSRCPLCVRYEVRGTALSSYICRVDQQISEAEMEEAQQALQCPHIDGPELFAVPAQQAPPIGGIINLAGRHSDFLLPGEVALFEPPESEIIKLGTRQIFLNTPLTSIEVDSLIRFHRTVAGAGYGCADGNFPRSIGIHSLRMLQKMKWDCAKALELMKITIRERNQRLPIAEADVLDDLRTGAFYWHGRDRLCRPCLIVRIERCGHMIKDRERTIRLILFMFEYVLRFAMVPGRVENWVVIIDVHNAMCAFSATHVISTFSVAQAISLMLEKVYCGRMGWIKIVNLPSAYLTKLVNGVIPADKKHKVSFPLDVAADLLQHFEPNQLEVRYGGTSPDLHPSDTYPFKFFERCRGELTEPERSPGVRQGTKDSCDSDSRHQLDSDEFSLHLCTNLAFHQGFLWDESTEEIKQQWIAEATKLSLTPHSASYLLKVSGHLVPPCRDMKTWVQIVLPIASRGRSDTVTNCAKDAKNARKPPLGLSAMAALLNGDGVLSL